MKPNVIPILVSLAISLVASGQSAQKLSATKANSYGLAYTLPVTAIDVTIEAQLTERKPGEFAKYATKYLNINNPVLEPERIISLKSVTINTAGVPDADRRYLITLKSTQAPYIMIGANNIPLAINTQDVMEIEDPALPVAQAPTPTPLETEAARQAVTQDMMMSHSSAKRAQLAAEQIYNLRQTRNDLLTGQADQMPPDGQAMKMILDNLDAQEAALMAMFVGTESLSTMVETVRVIPDDDINSQIIARLSALNGIVDIKDLSGSPITLNVRIIQEGEIPVDSKGNEVKFPAGGIAYTIPGQAEVSVSFDGKVVGSTVAEFAQFGVIHGMNPANFTSRKDPIYMIFDPRTGAAVEIGPAKVSD